jgi:hypothetical protein
LLPKVNYKSINCNLHDCFLIRYIDRVNNTEPIKGDDNQFLLKKLYSPSERIGDLSMSLLGHFKLEFNFIKITKEGKLAGYSDYCAPNFDGKSPLHPEHFVLDENRRFWAMPVKIFKKLTSTINRNNKIITAQCDVKHTPTKINFWHFSICWQIDGQDILTNPDYDEKEKATLFQKIGADVRATIKISATDNIIDQPGLEETCYIYA